MDPTSSTPSAEYVSPGWLAERAALSEKRLRSIPRTDLGPAGNLLLDAIDGPAHNPDHCGCEAEIMCCCPCWECNPPEHNDGDESA